MLGNDDIVVNKKSQRVRLAVLGLLMSYELRSVRQDSAGAFSSTTVAGQAL